MGYRVGGLTSGRVYAKNEYVFVMSISKTLD
jgi:hypothetical protein